MKIVVPVSACIGLPQQFSKEVWVIGQSAQAGTRQIFLDQHILSTVALKKGEIVRFRPVSLDGVVARLNELTIAEDILLLSSTASFDASAYSHIVQSIFPDRRRIYTCTLNCYGHALAYILQRVLMFVQQHGPSTAQVVLFIEGLNKNIRSFAACARSPILEPNLNPLLAWGQNWVKGDYIYQAEGEGWRRQRLDTVSESIASLPVEHVLAWVDSRHGEAYWPRLAKQLQRSGLSSESVIRNELQHVSRRLPQGFLFLTITPDQSSVEQLGRQVMRYSR